MIHKLRAHLRYKSIFFDSTWTISYAAWKITKSMTFVTLESVKVWMYFLSSRLIVSAPWNIRNELRMTIRTREMHVCHISSSTFLQWIFINARWLYQNRNFAGVPFQVPISKWYSSSFPSYTSRKRDSVSSIGTKTKVKWVICFYVVFDECKLFLWMFHETCSEDLGASLKYNGCLINLGLS